jgi:hypothetical protein
MPEYPNAAPIGSRRSNEQGSRAVYSAGFVMMPRLPAHRISGDVPNWIPRDIPNWIPRDIPNWIPRDIPNWVPRDVPNWIPRDVPNWIPRDVPSTRVTRPALRPNKMIGGSGTSTRRAQRPLPRQADPIWSRQ